MASRPPPPNMNDAEAVAAADKEMEERANRAKELLSQRYVGLKRSQVRAKCCTVFKKKTDDDDGGDEQQQRQACKQATNDEWLNLCQHFIAVFLFCFHVSFLTHVSIYPSLSIS